MSFRVPLSLAVLAALAPSAHAWEASEIPVDAPATCVNPTGTDDVTAMVRRGPKQLGVYRIANGRSIDTRELRIRAYGEFIPARLGSTRGEVQARFEASLLPDVVRDGENPDNTQFTTAPGSVRIGPYRVTVRPRTTKPLSYDATVEEIGCPETGVAPPLDTAGASRTFWVSTEGVMDYAFSTKPWFINADRMQVTLRTWLVPDVQQTDHNAPRGGITLHLWEGLDGHPTFDELGVDKLAGAKVELQDHRIEVLRVIYGKDTKLVDNHLVTRGDDPVASVLVRVTRMRVTPRGY